MAGTMRVEGIDEVSRMLEEVAEKAKDVAALALYDGAGVMADAYAQAANSIMVSDRHPPENVKRLATAEEKKALQGKIGIAKFDKNGSEVNTSVGVSGAGYVTIGGKQKAVRMLANAINHGTSFMTKQPVFRRAERQAQSAASAAIVAKAEQLIDDITK